MFVMLNRFVFRGSGDWVEASVGREYGIYWRGGGGGGALEGWVPSLFAGCQSHVRAHHKTNDDV